MRPSNRRLDYWIIGLLDKWIIRWRQSINPIIHLSTNPFVLLSVVLLLAGCAGYQLGPTNGLIAGDKTIQITPFLNHTLEPRLGDAVTTALRQRIQRDGTYRLATHGGADIIVTGVLTRYDRHVLNLQAQDVLTVKDYRVNVIASITVRDLSTGSSTNWTSTGYTLVRVGEDLTSAERQAMPLLAEDLAKNVTDSLVDGSW